MSPVLETQRLRLRCFDLGDAHFVLRLVNDPDWIRYIGDRKVHSLEDARRYLENGPLKMYAANGFGLWLVERKEDSVPVGMCGLIRRDRLKDVDLGFAMLPEFRSQGFAREASEGALAYARTALGLKRIVAIVSPGNEPSQRLLVKLGFAYESTIDWEPNDPVHLYAR